jgi:regulator of protease activity HflC (stomatin/prohibitin superfamily)
MFSDSYLLYLTPALLLFAVIIIGAGVRILREYERAVVFTLGRFQRVKGPGLVLFIPFFRACLACRVLATQLSLDRSVPATRLCPV